jgi:hypothetical protein
VRLSEERLEERYRIAKNGEEVHVLDLNDIKNREREILPYHIWMLKSNKLGLPIK